MTGDRKAEIKYNAIRYFNQVSVGE